MKRQDNAIFVFCKELNKHVCQFYNSIKNYDVYICIDFKDENYIEDKTEYKNLNFIQNEDIHDLIKNRYFGAYHDFFPFAADKAFKYIFESKPKYKFFWFIEDDVFFYKESVLLNIDKKYKNEDLLTKTLASKKVFDIKEANEIFWGDKFISDQYLTLAPSPVYRCSQRLLGSINTHFNHNKKMIKLSIWLASLCKQNNFSIKQPYEFQTLVEKRADFKIHEIHPCFLYHPVKNFNWQNKLRGFLGKRLTIT